MAEQLSDIQKVMRINPHAVDDRGMLKSISEQYAEYAFAKDVVGLPDAGKVFMPLVLTANCSIYDIPELEGKPLVIFNSALKHIERKHHGSIADIADLGRELAANLLVYQDPDKDSHYIFVLESISQGGNRLIAALEAEARADSLSVVKVSTVHGKRDLSAHIESTLAMGKKVYVNKRTGVWLGCTRDSRYQFENSELTKEAHQRLSNLYCTRYPEDAARMGIAPSPECVRDLAKTALGNTKVSGMVTKGKHFKV